MVDYWSVSASIIIIVGVFMYQYMPEENPCKIYIPSTIINSHILTFLQPKNRLYINKEINKDAIISNRRLFVGTHYPDDILKSLGGIDKCVNNYCFIERSSSLVFTKNNDMIRVEDLPDTDNNVYLGIDSSNRPFAILKYWVAPTGDYNTDGNEESSQYQPLKYPKQVVVVMFQKSNLLYSPHMYGAFYANYIMSWHIGSYYNSHYIPGDIRITKDTLEKIARLLQGTRVIIKGWRSQALVLGITKEVAYI
jgi:hypothetical protein